MPMPAEFEPSAPDLCWIVPPEPAVPVPVTVRPPDEPVESREMPLPALSTAVPAEIDGKVNRAAPIVVPLTFNAVPEPLARMVFPVPCTATLRPPVAGNPAPQ